MVVIAFFLVMLKCTLFLFLYGERVKASCSIMEESEGWKLTNYTLEAFVSKKNGDIKWIRRKGDGIGVLGNGRSGSAVIRFVVPNRV